MRNEIEIKNLLQRFGQGISTPDENEKLYNYLTKDRREFEELVQLIWSETPQYGNVKDAERILNEIHGKLGFKSNKHSLETKDKVLRIYKNAMRYAAIFIIGFGLAWLVNSILKKQPGNKVNVGVYKVNVAYGSKSTIELPDGSIVTLNSGSTLAYSCDYNKDKRIVMLNGEAYFDVKKDTTSPFLVQTKDITVKVHGTTFNVKSYIEDNTIETTLVTGKVEILANKKSGTTENEKTVFLLPNQKAIIQQISNGMRTENPVRNFPSNSYLTIGNLKVLVLSKVNTDIEISWKNNILTFNSEPFSQIVKKLERWYNVKVDLKYNKLKPVIFSGKFDKESIGEVLHALSLIEPFKFKMNKNIITIYK